MERRHYDRRQSEPYVGFVHARVYEDLFASSPRRSWYAAYRRARRAGTRHVLTPREVLFRYPTRPLSAEFGRIESFRFFRN